MKKIFLLLLVLGATLSSRAEFILTFTYNEPTNTTRLDYTGTWNGSADANFTSAGSASLSSSGLINLQGDFGTIFEAPNTPTIPWGDAQPTEVGGDNWGFEDQATSFGTTLYGPPSFTVTTLTTGFMIFENQSPSDLGLSTSEIANGGELDFGNGHIVTWNVVVERNEITLDFIYNEEQDQTFATFSGKWASTAESTATTSGAFGLSLDNPGFARLDDEFGVVFESPNEPSVPWVTAVATDSIGVDWGFQNFATVAGTTLYGPVGFGPDTEISGTLRFVQKNLSELGFDASEIANGGVLDFGNGNRVVWTAGISENTNPTGFQLDFVYDEASDTTIATYSGTWESPARGSGQATTTAELTDGVLSLQGDYGFVIESPGDPTIPWNNFPATSFTGDPWGFVNQATSFGTTLYGPANFNQGMTISGALYFQGTDLAELGFSASEIANGGTLNLGNGNIVNWTASVQDSTAGTSNIDGVTAPNSPRVFFQAGQAFTTGSTASTLESITVRLQGFAGSSDVQFSIREDNGGQPSETILETLETATAPVGIANTAQDAAGSTVLQPNTQYWLVLELIGGDIDWPTTTAPATTGSIQGGLFFRDNAGQAWQSEAPSEAFRFEIDASPISQPLVFIATSAKEIAEGTTSNGGIFTDFVFERAGDTSGTTVLNYEVLGFGSSPASSSDVGNGFGSSSVTFNPGETEKSSSVLVTRDAISELDESFGISLTSAPGATLVSDVVATIIRDDDTATINLDDIGTVNEEDGTAELTVSIPPFVNFLDTLPRSVDVDVIFEVTTTAGTASAGDDYLALSSESFTFPAGQTSATVTIQLVDDSSIEDPETLTVMIANLDANGQSVNLGNVETTLTIVDGDTDGDGLIDDWERFFFDSLLTSDGLIDSDGDALLDIDEQTAMTNPTLKFTDGDRLDDGSEVAFGLDPLVTDDIPDAVLDAFLATATRDPGIIALEGPFTSVVDDQVQITIQFNAGSDLDDLEPMGEPIDFLFPAPTIENPADFYQLIVSP